MAASDDIFSERFRRWEQRGRGWQVFADPIAPEPPFVPFPGDFFPPMPVDDGRRPTFLSSFVRRVSNTLSPESPAPEAVESDDEPEPIGLTRDSLLEFQASLPDKLDVSKEVFEQFLVNLSLCHEPIAFELIGNHKKVTAQFAAAQSD